MTVASLTTAPAAPATAPKSASPATSAAPEVLAIAPTGDTADPTGLSAAIAAARQSAAVRQDGLAVLMANLMQVSGKLPPALLAALDQLIALHLPTDTAPDADAVKRAVRSSGLFTESKLANNAPRADIAQDVKTVLLRLNDAAERWQARAAPSPVPSAETRSAAPNKPSPKTEDVHAVKTSDTKTAATPTRASESDARLAPAAQITTSAAGRSGGAAPQAPAAPPAGQAAPLHTDAGARARTPASGTAPTQGAVTLPTPNVPVAAPSTASVLTATPPTPNVAAPGPEALKAALGQLKAAAETWLRTAPSTPAAQTPVLPTVNNTQRLDAPVAPVGAPVRLDAGPRIPPPAEPSPTPQAARPTTAPLPTPTGNAPSAPAEVSVKPTSVVRSPNVSASATAASTTPTAPPPAAAPDTDVADPVSLPAAMATIGRLTQAILSPAGERADVSPEMKAVLALLNRTAEQFSGSPAPEPAPSPSRLPEQAAQPDLSMTRTGPSSPQTQSVPNELKTVLLLLNKVAENWFERQTPAPSTDPRPTPPNPPAADPRSTTPSVPPPVAGAPSKAQPAAVATLPDGADALVTAAKLVTGSDAAVARQTLLQIASLPEAAQQQGRAPDARWLFDLPVMTPQGAAVAQLIIERDGSHTTSDSPKAVWRVQFAIDIEPLGPVRANLAICGDRTWVTIGAERPESLDKLRSGVSWLTDALQATELNADIAFQIGAAPARKKAARRLVDHAL